MGVSRVNSSLTFTFDTEKTEAGIPDGPAVSGQLTRGMPPSDFLSVNLWNEFELINISFCLRVFESLLRLLNYA